MSARKKTGSAGLVLGSIGSSGSSLTRPTIGANRLTLASRQRVTQARTADVDEMARIMSQLFTDPQQATAISALKDASGKPFFTLQNKARLMDVRALVRRDGFDTTLSFLQGERMKDASVIIAETPLLEAVRSQQQLEDEMVERKEDVTEGEYTCKCKSRRVGRRLKQTRSADEPATVFLRCTTCGTRWRE